MLRADAPLLFLREVLSGFVFFSGLGLLYSFRLFVGLCPFGNKFLIIQKKNKDLRAYHGEDLRASLFFPAMGD